MSESGERKLPRITLVTPTYNQAEFIKDTLASVAEQAYPNLEHIVVDAMSTDATPEILAPYADRGEIRWIREKDAGQSDAINKGMRLGTGSVAGWLNSDDVLMPGALLEVGEQFSQFPDAAVIYGRGMKTDREGNELYTVPFRKFDRRALATAYRVVQPAMFFSRQAYLDCGALDVDLHYAMDWELLIRLAARGDVIAIDRVWAKIRYYDETKTSTGGWERLREIAEIGRKHGGTQNANYVAFRVRETVAKLNSKFAERITDELLRRVYANTPVMVVGWPRDFSG